MSLAFWRMLAASLQILTAAPPEEVGAVDGGLPTNAQTLSAEDQEILKHLDLLENLPEVEDLELLQELSKSETPSEGQ